MRYDVFKIVSTIYFHIDYSLIVDTIMHNAHARINKFLAIIHIYIYSIYIYIYRIQLYTCIRRRRALRATLEIWTIWIWINIVSKNEFVSYFYLPLTHTNQFAALNAVMRKNEKIYFSDIKTIWPFRARTWLSIN